LLIPASLHADCAGAGIWVWPKGESISAEQTFLIEGYAESQNMIRKLVRGYRAVLWDGNTMIDLNVVGRYEGDMHLSLVILKSTMALTVGTTYELSIVGLRNGEEQPYRWNNDTHTKEPIRWTVSAEQQELASLIPQPREIKKTLIHYGCGPAEWVKFEIANANSPAALVLVTVIEKGSQRLTRYVLQVEEGHVQIGHGMCSGAFTFTTGESYSVTFDPIGADGKATGRPTTPVIFTPPVVETFDD
jgi:hypothetical protein